MKTNSLPGGGPVARRPLLDLGPHPRTDVVADLRDDIRDGLHMAEDLECTYAAVLYPEPNRTAEHVWVAAAPHLPGRATSVSDSSGGLPACPAGS